MGAHVCMKIEKRPRYLLLCAWSARAIGMMLMLHSHRQLILTLDPKRESQTVCSQLLLQIEDLQKEVTCMRGLFDRVSTSPTAAELYWALGNEQPRQDTLHSVVVTILVLWNFQYSKCPFQFLSLPSVLYLCSWLYRHLLFCTISALRNFLKHCIHTPFAMFSTPVIGTVTAADNKETSDVCQTCRLCLYIIGCSRTISVCMTWKSGSVFGHLNQPELVNTCLPDTVWDQIILIPIVCFILWPLAMCFVFLLFSRIVFRRNFSAWLVTSKVTLSLVIMRCLFSLIGKRCLKMLVTEIGWHSCLALV